MCAIYRHPNGNIEHFTNDIDILCQKIDPNRIQLLVGDINIDLIRYEENKILSYLTMLMSHSYVPLITLPTRLTYHSATCIDHIFIKTNKEFYVHPGIIYADISDHLPTFVAIDNITRPNLKERPMVRIFSDTNCQRFKEKINTLNWDQIFNRDHNCLTKLNNTISDIYKQWFPLKRQSRGRQRDKPWIIKGLKISIKTQK